MFKIGDIEIKNRVVMAPMAGITNGAFRKIVHQFGAGLTYGEMVSDKALCFNSENTYRMLEVSEEEGIVAMQLFGGELESMVKAAQIIEKECRAPILDINMGCPVPKVIKSKAGSYLLKDIDYAYNLIKSIVEAVNKPVTVKLRLGYDNNHINVVSMAKAMEQAGVKAIAVHGRTKSQMYEGRADWSYIKKVKETVKVPVIGNGDIKSCYDAKRMIEETNCDAIMIARGALGNPWLIKECVDYLEKGILPSIVTVEDKLRMILYHAKELIKISPSELIAMKEMRSHACWYFKGLDNSNKYKIKLNAMKTLDDLITIIKDYYYEVFSIQLQLDS